MSTGLARRPRRVTLAVPLVLLLVVGLLTGTAHADSIREQQQWALDAVNAPEAWRTTRGEGVTVAVLDTGVDADHPDLVGSVLEGRDFVGMGARPGDEHWAAHGTAMAGIIAGHGHGPGRDSGVMGVAPAARILPVRVLLEDDDPAREEARDARADALADGIRWAADQGADVINLSLGDDSASAHADPEEDAAVRYALRKGCVVVASAGNGGERGDPVSYPAGYPGVIAATAVDRAGQPAEFSTRRWYATVSAPGQDVIVADPGGEYYAGWGTSAAAAFVSGAAALLRAAHPDLSPAEVRRLLTDTAQNPPPGGRDDAVGAGVVDAAAALAAAAAADPEDAEESTGTDASGGPAVATEPYTGRYFGAGPVAVGGAAAGGSWLAPAAAVLGVLLLFAAAVLLARGGRPQAAGAAPPGPPPPRPAPQRERVGLAAASPGDPGHRPGDGWDEPDDADRPETAAADDEANEASKNEAGGASGSDGGTGRAGSGDDEGATPPPPRR